MFDVAVPIDQPTPDKTSGLFGPKAQRNEEDEYLGNMFLLMCNIAIWIREENYGTSLSKEQRKDVDNLLINDANIFFKEATNTTPFAATNQSNSRANFKSVSYCIMSVSLGD